MEAKIEQKYQEAKELAPADLKLMLLGDTAVGKSKLVERFLLDDYEERTSSTHALTMYRHTHMVKGKSLAIDIWDTAGQEAFDTLHPSYYFKAHVCVLVFDATRKITYQNLRKWYKEMRSHLPYVPCILIANKIDIDKRVTERSYKFAEQTKLPFYFVSAADGTNVVQIFEEALERGLDYKINPPKDDFMNEVMELLEDEVLFGTDP